MTAPAAHQSLSCHQSLVHLPAAQVDTEQLQSMTSACGSMTGNIKAKKKNRNQTTFSRFWKSRAYYCGQLEKLAILVYLPLTWENWIFWFKNQMVYAILFGKLQKVWTVIWDDAISLLISVCSANLNILCHRLFSHHIKLYTIVLCLYTRFPPSWFV